MAEGFSNGVNGAAVAGLDQLVALIAESMGLHFPENKRQDLWRVVQSLARQHGQKDTESFIRSMIASRLTEQQIEMLAAHLTVGETYFFREMESLEAFRDHLLPELICRRSERERRLRIWSAGCGSGDETYTVATLVDQRIPDAKGWDIRIYGTDINPRVLEKARHGVYTKWSLRGVSAALRDRYFETTGPETYSVKARFREMVSFASHNLATEDYPSILNNAGEMDVIFCRNVMIYLTPPAVQRVIRRFHRCLAEGGWLIVAPCETSALLASEFKAVTFAGATLYRKIGPAPPAAKVWVPAAGVAPKRSVAERSVPAPFVWPEPLPATPAPARANRSPLYEAALADYGRGRYDEAAATLRMLLAESVPGTQEEETDADAYALMARVFANQGNLEEAFLWCEKAVAADKTSPRHCYLLAMILLEQGREKDAVQAIKRALYLDPEFIAADYALGNIAARGNRHKDVSRHFRNVAALLSKMPQENTLPELGGMTAGRLLETIQTMMTEGGVR